MIIKKEILLKWSSITLQGLIRLWWNSVHRTVLSISRSREEDDNDWSTLSWVIATNVIIPWSFTRKKNKCLRIDRKVSYLVELEKLYLWEKNQPSISFLWERYRSQNFSWKFPKKPKTFVGLSFFLLYGQKWISNIYSCSSWARAFAHMFLLILHLYEKSVFWCTLVISDRNDNAHN